MNLTGNFLDGSTLNSNLIAVYAFIVSAIALIATLLRDFILPSIFYPRLTVSYTDYGCVHNNIPILINGQSVGSADFLRLKLINDVGFLSKPAQRCYIKLLEISDPSGSKITPFTPYLLKWAIYDKYRVHLAKGEFNYVDLVSKSASGPLKPGTKMSTATNWGNLTQVGVYVFRVGVYGDNVHPQEIEVKIRNDQQTATFVA